MKALLNETLQRRRSDVTRRPVSLEEPVDKVRAGMQIIRVGYWCNRVRMDRGSTLGATTGVSKVRSANLNLH